MEYLTREFIAESRESLDHMERCLTRLEERPSDAPLVDEIFRSIHTVKGATGFLGFSRLESLAHAGEHLLGAFRAARLSVTSQHITLLLRLLDRIRRILNVIEATGAEEVRMPGQEDQDDVLLESLRQALAPAAHPAPRPAGLDRSSVADAPFDGSLSESAGNSIRLDVDLMNRMMNLVGELVLTRNRVLQCGLSAPGFADLGRQLDSVTTNLRVTVTQARMQPVGDLFQKYPRMVRDLGKSCGRIVRLECSGQDVGLDRSLLEKIKDPISHAVRNAVDHGIEPPGTRIRIGKPVSGVIRLHAEQRGDSVTIEVSDDGAGIPVEKVRERALRHGLVSVEEALTMPESEMLRMVFRPGFSTGDVVTQVSGRGVGMDVVRSNVEQCGGSVELESKEGRGTTLRIRVPLTLAIVQALAVVSAGQVFAIPQGLLREVVDLPDGALVSQPGGLERYTLRGESLPVLRLDRLLQLERQQGQPKSVYLAVIQTGEARFGLMIDDLLAPEEIVVKPLSAVLRESGMFSGAAVLANGSFALVLDLAGIAQRAGHDLRIPPAEAAGGIEDVQSHAQPFLLCDPGGREDEPARTAAIPIHCVQRIESVPVDAVEYRGGLPYLAHGGRMLPLTGGAGVLGRSPGAGNSLTVLICAVDSSRAGDAGSFGLVVERVFDVARGSLSAPGIGMPWHHAMVGRRPTRVLEPFAGALDWPLPETVPATGVMA